MLPLVKINIKEICEIVEDFTHPGKCIKLRVENYFTKPFCIL